MNLTLFMFLLIRNMIRFLKISDPYFFVYSSETTRNKEVIEIIVSTHMSSSSSLSTLLNYGPNDRLVG